GLPLPPAVARPRHIDRHRARRRGRRRDQGRRRPARDRALHRLAARRHGWAYRYRRLRYAARLIIVSGGRSGEATAARHRTRGSAAIWAPHSGLILAALMIGHQVAISAL